MVLSILDAVFRSPFFPSSYVQHIVLAVAAVLVIRAFAQGKTTSRDRDLHARTIIMTGAFTPLGLTTIQSLAQRGAHIIALTSGDVESPQSEATILVELLRSTTSNQEIYAEHCDLSSPTSIQSFCTKFMSGDNTRIDAVLLMHEYQHVGPFDFLKTSSVDMEQERQTRSLATFHLITTLLPGLLIAPAERDIRIINVVNRFYAAAATTAFSLPFSRFSSDFTTSRSQSIFLSEGTRSLKTCILTRHIQRVLDALPAAQIPKTEVNSSTIPVVNSSAQKSNIVTIAVSPGISRVDTIAPLLNADWTSPFGWSYLGVFIYLVAQPFLRLFIKTPHSSMQTVLHALFLPTPFKIILNEKPGSAGGDASTTVIDKSVLEMPEEILKPGALYAECAVVKLNVPTIPLPSQEKAKGKAKEAEETLELADDGELGGEAMGRAVWEAYEAAVKVWQDREPKETKDAEKIPSGGAASEATH